MNKTVNINLAGIFFHIDEDAYLKLQRYLEAIKRSFTDSQGRSEIISDIEARIAELFNERVQNDKQVIRLKEVDDVISIMGQPEDYLVDDEIFEDEPQKTHYKKTSSKKLFRDTDSSYVGGVASGLAHYLGIDSVWMRLLWIILAIGSGGTFIFIYILFWILMPAAETTSDKLAMSGKPINITNIEEKVKEGIGNVKDSIDEVTDKVKNGDYSKVGNKVKSSSKTFFDTLGDVGMFFLKIIAKFIGVILMIVGASTLIALFISMFSLGTSSFFSPWWMDYAHMANTSGSPIWLIALITFFAVGVPFFFIFYLGLKILVNNLKSIGSVAKFTLLGLWLMSIISIAVIGIGQLGEHAFDASVTEKKQLNIRSNDTLRLSMAKNTMYSKQLRRHSDIFRPVYDENDNKVLYNSDIRLIVRSTKDSLASISIEKNAEGKNYQLAKERAQKINYGYTFLDNTLKLNGYLTTGFENKFRNQEVEVILYLPEGTILYADENTYSFHRNSSYYNDILDNGMEEHYLEIIDDDVKCLDCEDDNFKVDVDVENETSGLKIDEDGLEVKTENNSLKIDENGVKAKSEDVKVSIDEDGIEVKSENY
ncbi:PspC domain-containing protein [Ichthyenterobacterium magnum]|uniref:Phage shock protein C (PspC) family protein n=1 Tax=Ichthyenterobacterium magnum TaxID=1230530 RepID=A0A420DGP9_9FLAO|nr:PspC domain-containing protein [Ichthyenterobacterium magnum]RKE92257.1 phage shock protein C (PspC) family protein [Ichthyenterobacterium magnum]